MRTVAQPKPPHTRTGEEWETFHKHSEHWATAMGLVVLLQGIVVFWLVLTFWSAAAGTEATTVEPLWGVRWTVTADVAMIALIMSAGGLGAVVYEAQSLSYHRGKDDFKSDWDMWYLLRPLVGAGLAAVLYFAVRGGLLQVDSTSEDINLFGMVALAGLAGLFSTPAMTKLSNVFDAMLGRAEPPETEHTSDSSQTVGGTTTGASATRA
jgi:hypothetical protein